MIVDDDVPGFSSVEEVESLLLDAGVSRVVRRRVVSDARTFARALVAAGADASAVRFRVIECRDCGKLELTVDDGNRGRRVCH